MVCDFSGWRHVSQLYTIGEKMSIHATAESDSSCYTSQTAPKRPRSPIALFRLSLPVLRWLQRGESNVWHRISSLITYSITAIVWKQEQRMLLLYWPQTLQNLCRRRSLQIWSNKNFHISFLYSRRRSWPQESQSADFCKGLLQRASRF